MVIAFDSRRKLSIDKRLDTVVQHATLTADLDIGRSTLAAVSIKWRDIGTAARFSIACEINVAVDPPERRPRVSDDPVVFAFFAAVTNQLYPTRSEIVVKFLNHTSRLLNRATQPIAELKVLTGDRGQDWSCFRRQKFQTRSHAMPLHRRRSPQDPS